MVIFAGRNFAKMLARHFTWGNFHDVTPISFIKAYGFNFRVGVNFAKKTKAQKREKYPTRKFPHLQYVNVIYPCFMCIFNIFIYIETGEFQGNCHFKICGFVFNFNLCCHLKVSPVLFYKMLWT